jgi:two-component system sensor histidine kinase YesM
MRYLLKSFLDLKITSKIMICFVAMLVIFLSVGNITYHQYQNLAADKVRQMSFETTRSVSNNLDFIFDTMNNQSIILLSNQTIQTAMEQSNREYNWLLQNRVCNYLAEFMNFNDMISSIYIFDQNGVEYYVDNTSYKNMSLGKIHKAAWYPQLMDLNGGYLLKLNGGGTFTAGKDNYISLVRIINNINTQKPMGIMVMNVASDSILRTVMKQNNAYDMQLVLTDESGQNILDSTPPGVKNIAYSTGKIPSGSSEIMKINGKSYIVSSLDNRYGWVITNINSFNEFTEQITATNVTLVIFILAFGILFLATFTVISILIARPIRKLAVSMKAVENGDFREIHIKTGNDEIGHLKDVYNMMVRRIVILIDDILKEQAMKRKKELEVLQMQIKPHFLYNSFDAIGALALSGNNVDVFRLVQALGRFYRGFLSACDEAITIGEELKITESYITIQTIRFPDKFTVVKEIDPEVLGAKIPSLTLQPLVENAIDHGIRGKSGAGTLTIKAFATGNFIRIMVEDDGVGMEEGRIAEILGHHSKGVGMKATMEKLNLYFEADNVLTIESKKDCGTKVTINIPANRGE